mgnify:CR=1 FL=1
MAASVPADSANTPHHASRLKRGIRMMIERRRFMWDEKEGRLIEVPVPVSERPVIVPVEPPLHTGLYL